MTCFLLLALLAGGCEGPQIRPDESVLFFPTLGRLAEDGSNWKINVHGWIFEREEDSEARQALIGLLRAALGAGGAGKESESLKERLQPFLFDGERGKIVSIRVGERVFPLEESLESGHFQGTVTLSSSEVARILRGDGAGGKDGAGGGQGRPARWIPFQAAAPEGDARVFRGEALLLDGAGLSVISDVDDTIKVSEVLDKKALLRNTLLREFRPVPGMAELYAGWAKRGAAFHFVTASPWQLFEPLSAFLKASGFPEGTFHMKRFRLKDSSLFEIFASPVDYKRGEIDPLVEAFPKRSFVLVGDSGEKDPEIYAAVARKYPGQVKRILIRDVTGEGAASGRMRKAFEGLPAELWKVFREPTEVPPLLEEAPGRQR